MIICPACGKENEQSAFECRRCRAPFREEEAAHAEPAGEHHEAAPANAMGAVCPRCEAYNEPGVAECTNCGAQLFGEPAAAGAEPPLDKTPAQAWEPPHHEESPSVSVADELSALALSPEEAAEAVVPGNGGSSGAVRVHDELDKTPPQPFQIEHAAAPLAAESPAVEVRRESPRPSAPPARQAAARGEVAPGGAVSRRAPEPPPPPAPAAPARQEPAAAPAPMEKPCASCGALNPPAAKFCFDCGTPFAKKAAPSAPPPEPAAAPAPPAAPAPERATSPESVAHDEPAPAPSHGDTPYVASDEAAQPAHDEPASARAAHDHAAHDHAAHDHAAHDHAAHDHAAQDEHAHAADADEHAARDEHAQPSHDEPAFATPEGEPAFSEADVHAAEQAVAHEEAAAQAFAEPAAAFAEPEPGEHADPLAQAPAHEPADFVEADPPYAQADEAHAEAAPEEALEAASVAEEPVAEEAAPVEEAPAEQPAPFHAALVVEQGASAGTQYVLAFQVNAIGSAGTHVELGEDPFIAPHAATLTFADDHLVLRDEGSANGIYLKVREQAPLEPGDHFIAGERLLRYDGPVELPRSPGDGTPWLGAPRPPTDRIVRVTEVLTAGRTGRTCHRAGPVIAVGRTGCDLNFPGDARLAARHAEIRLDEDGQATLVDLGQSPSGVLLRVRAEQPVHAGDVLQLGDQVIRLEVG